MRQSQLDVHHVVVNFITLKSRDVHIRSSRAAVLQVLHVSLLQHT